MLNAFRTTVLLAAMTALFMVVGYLVGGMVGMMIAFGVAVVTNLIGYWNSDKLVLRMQNARAVEPRQAPELYDMVADLAERAGLPMPALYVIEAEQPNAFATGRNPQNAAVAVSRGLVQMLNTRELAGVIAHELAHIRSRDTLVMTLTATLAGAISMLAQFGFFFGGRNSNSPFGFVGALAAMIVAPLAAMMVQMAISRTREYEADRDGAEISGDPLALASALQKISQMAQRVENPNASRTPGMAHMFIINPLAGRSGDSLFATHPSVDNRVAELEKLAGQMRGQAQPEVKSRSSRAERPAATISQTRGAGWRIPSTDPQRRDNDHGKRRGPWG